MPSFKPFRKAAAWPKQFCIPFLLSATVGAMVLSGCSLFSSSGSDDDKDTKYVERPVEQIYADAWKRIRERAWSDAAKQFDEVERQHPYSIWARRAMLMSAFCYYQANKYTEAINSAYQYISFAPPRTKEAVLIFLSSLS